MKWTRWIRKHTILIGAGYKEEEEEICAVYIRRNDE